MRVLAHFSSHIWMRPVLSVGCAWAPACDSGLCRKPLLPASCIPWPAFLEGCGHWCLVSRGRGGVRTGEELGRQAWRLVQGSLAGNCSFPGTWSVVYRWGDGKRGFQGTHRLLMLLWGGIARGRPRWTF